MEAFKLHHFNLGTFELVDLSIDLVELLVGGGTEILATGGIGNGM